MKRQISQIVILASAAVLAAERPGWAVDIRKENAELAHRLVAIIKNATGAYTPQARVRAAHTLQEMGTTASSVVPELAGILSNSVRGYPLALDEAIVNALGEMGAAARQAIPAMVQNSGQDGDLDRAVRAAVSNVLRAPQATRQVIDLIDLLRDRNPAVRLEAAKELAGLGRDATPAVPALTRTLADPDRDVRVQSLSALQVIRPGAPVTPAVLGVYIRDLTEVDETIRLQAAKALARIGPAAQFALPALQAAARRDPDEDVRRMAADAVTRIQGPPALP